jgi:hypothetical protein
MIFIYFAIFIIRTSYSHLSFYKQSIRAPVLLSKDKQFIRTPAFSISSAKILYKKSIPSSKTCNIVSVLVQAAIKAGQI